MATKYTFKFTDALKSTFDVQSYTANGILVPSSTALLPRATQANTTLKIYGKGLPDYGEGVFQDMVYMLENFANVDKPEFSIEGQLWYKNVATGSPAVGPELFIRNITGNGDDLVNDWDAVILATGTSRMTGELLLSGIPVDPDAAIPLSMLTDHESETGGLYHLTARQNTFMDGLDVEGSPPALTSTDVNQLIGITGNVQTLLDNKLSLDGGTMTAGLSPAANITFSGGEVLGLPVTPSGATAATSMQYVDDQDIATATGELVDVTFVSAPAAGSPPVIVDTSLTSALFTITSPTNTYFLQLDDISRAGHLHDAIDIVLDNTFNPLYPTNVQGAFEYVNDEIASIDGGTGGTDVNITIERKFDVLASDILVGSPIAPYEVLSHFTTDNALSITINGIKQYTHVHAFQNIVFDTNVTSMSVVQPTYIDPSLNYDFNISVDGGPNTLITLLAGTSLASHGELQAAINAALAGSPPDANATYQVIADTDHVQFNAVSSGTGSSILISDPATANTFLFDIDAAPGTIQTATFLSEQSIVDTGSPAGSPIITPDSIEILGDVTATFPVGKVFSIRGSSDATYGSFDGAYSVHVNGAVAAGSPLTTTIPIATPQDSAVNTPLLQNYNPSVGSPPPVAPSPSAYGMTYITPIIGMDSIASAVAGVEGDYVETDASGNPTNVNELTTHVVFNYDIPTGSKIETLKYT